MQVSGVCLMQLLLLLLLTVDSSSSPCHACAAALADSWATADGSSKLSAALRELAELGLLGKELHGGQDTLRVDAGFHAQLRRTMCSG